MKCPKCHYLSFDPEPRCRNCGYTLALGEDVDLAIKADAPEDNSLDLALRAGDGESEVAAPIDALLDADADDAPRTARPGAARRRRRAPAARGPFDGTDALEGGRHDRDDATGGESLDAQHPAADQSLASAPPPAIRAARPPVPEVPPTAELPLFVKAMPSTAELELPDRSSPGDPPVAVIPVSRQTPVTRTTVPDTGARPRVADPARRLGPLDRDLLEDLERIETHERLEADVAARAARKGEPAGAGLRLGAAIVDASLLAGLGAGIVWTTLRWCDLTPAQLRILPVAPMAGFLLLMGFGYLLIFTAAGGQTLGKMLFGLRVVSAGPADADGGVVSLGQALYREVVALPSILALGLGFLPGLVGDRRALHDRLAHTQVVRA